MLLLPLKPSFFIPIGEYRERGPGTFFVTLKSAQPQYLEILQKQIDLMAAPKDVVHLIDESEYDAVAHRFEQGDLIHVEDCFYLLFLKYQLNADNESIQLGEQYYIQTRAKDVTRYDAEVSAPVVLQMTFIACFYIEAFLFPNRTITIQRVPLSILNMSLRTI